MNKIKYIIVDDENTALNRLESLLKLYDDLELVSKFTNPVLAINEILNKKPDLIFVDIEMPAKSGIDLVLEIHENNFYPIVIFISAYPQYAIQSIKINVFDYLLKPININDLNVTIKGLKHRCNNTNVVNISDSIVCTDLSDREVEILQFIMMGDTSESVAAKLFICKTTVDFHRKNILLKTDSVNLISLIQKINQTKYLP